MARTFDGLKLLRINKMQICQVNYMCLITYVHDCVNYEWFPEGNKRLRFLILIFRVSSWNLSPGFYGNDLKEL